MIFGLLLSAVVLPVMSDYILSGIVIDAESKECTLVIACDHNRYVYIYDNIDRPLKSKKHCLDNYMCFSIQSISNDAIKIKIGDNDTEASVHTGQSLFSAL